MAGGLDPRESSVSDLRSHADGAGLPQQMILDSTILLVDPFRPDLSAAGQDLHRCALVVVTNHSLASPRSSYLDFEHTGWLGSRPGTWPIVGRHTWVSVRPATPKRRTKHGDRASGAHGHSGESFRIGMARSVLNGSGNRPRASTVRRAPRTAWRTTLSMRVG